MAHSINIHTHLTPHTLHWFSHRSRSEVTWNSFYVRKMVLYSTTNFDCSYTRLSVIIFAFAVMICFAMGWKRKLSIKNIISETQIYHKIKIADNVDTIGIQWTITYFNKIIHQYHLYCRKLHEIPLKIAYKTLFIGFNSRYCIYLTIKNTENLY